MIQSGKKMGLESLERSLHHDLKMIEYPVAVKSNTSDTCDVVIVGAGMAGLSAAFALMRQGVTTLRIYDENDEGYEGPWTTSARMETLRSGKEYMGPALFLPNLTFHAWYKARFGNKAWRDLDKIPTNLWAEYLVWYKDVLGLPVVNGCRLQTIIPDHEQIRLSFTNSRGAQFEVTTYKVVLATGRGGFGGFEIPAFAQKLSTQRCAHTGHALSAEQVQGKRIAIVGVGASAFDAAAYVMENGARSVDLLMRREQPPLVVKSWYIANAGAYNGFFYLKNEDRWEMFKSIFAGGTTVPPNALKRIAKFSAIKLHSNITIQDMMEENDVVKIVCDDQTFNADFVILATGFAIDGTMRSELASFIDTVLLWRDVMGEGRSSLERKVGRFPYLGPHFEFLEKGPGSAPYLKNIHCFNYAASVSHGLISSDIPGISFGAQRLAEGIAADLFIRKAREHVTNIESFSRGQLAYNDFDWLRR
jgi:cation diffusion facilitator CzcD-associated flavoprotein CzcO